MLRANNYEPIIIDLNNTVVHSQNEKYLDYCKKIIIDSLNKHKPDLVGMNCLFSGNFPDILEFAKVIKLHSPELKIAVGVYILQLFLRKFYPTVMTLILWQ